MIYLIKTGFTNITLLKIGYTNDLESRIKAYRTHNPLVELISSREGGSELENYLHKYFSDYSYPDQLEWFYFNDYIIDNFLKVKLEEYISREKLINILSHQLKLGKRNTKNLEDKYIEKYGKEDFELRKCYLYRFWEDLNDFLLEYLLEGDCPDKIPIDSTITIKNLPFGLDSISLDLLQILGRQKLDPSCQKTTVEFCYKILGSKKTMTKEVFEKKKEEKLASSKRLLSLWNKADSGERAELSKKFRSDVEVRNYMDDFISVNTKTGTPEINKLIQIADQRAWEICQKDYQDSINAVKALSDSGYVAIKQQHQTEEHKEAGKLLSKIVAHPRFTDQLKEYCEIMDDKSISEEIKEFLNSDLENPMMEQYYLFFGTKGCKARKFRDNELKKGWEDKFVFPKLTDKIYQEFKVGDRLIRKNIRNKLQEIYSKLKINKKVMAIDLNAWFETKEIKIGSRGQQSRGLELIKKLKKEED